jgi:hypothetical protein
MKKPTNPPPSPPVENRAVTTNQVRVRAQEPLGEIIDGEMHRFAKGDEFALPADRVKALGPLVEPLPAPGS